MKISICPKCKHPYDMDYVHKCISLSYFEKETLRLLKKIVNCQLSLMETAGWSVTESDYEDENKV